MLLECCFCLVLYIGELFWTISGKGSTDAHTKQATSLSKIGKSSRKYSTSILYSAVAYESGIDQVARFEASIEIFGDAKAVKVCVGTLFIKGLPTTMTVKETLPDGDHTGNRRPAGRIEVSSHSSC